MNKNKLVIASASLLLVSFSLAGCTNTSLTSLSNSKETSSPTPQQEKANESSTPAPSTSPAAPEQPSGQNVEQPNSTALNGDLGSQPVAPPVPAAQATSTYGDPTSCPPGSTLVNDIPQLPPMCSVPISSDFIEVGQPPADSYDTLFQ